MMDHEFLNPIEELVLKIVQEAGLELFECKLNRHKQNILIQILVDKTHGGVTIEQCAQLHRQIQQEFEARQLFNSPYRMELASPGADRLLRSKKDFVRVLNREVRFLLLPVEQLKGEYVGEVIDATDDEVRIMSQGEQVSIPIDSIKKAEQIL